MQNGRGLLTGSLLLLSLALAAVAEEKKPADRPPYERHLAGDDTRKAAELARQMAEREAADDYAGALRAAEELLALRRKALAIGRQARRHLGVNRRRDREWLEEYYFALTCYGVQTGKFEGSYLRRDWVAAYISAGVAARRLSRPWTLLGGEIRTREN